MKDIYLYFSTVLYCNSIRPVDTLLAGISSGLLSSQRWASPQSQPVVNSPAPVSSQSCTLGPQPRAGARLDCTSELLLHVGAFVKFKENASSREWPGYVMHNIVIICTFSMCLWPWMLTRSLPWTLTARGFPNWSIWISWSTSAGLPLMIMTFLKLRVSTAAWSWRSFLSTTTTT